MCIMGHHHGNHQLGHSPSQALSTQSNPSTPPFTLPPTATTSPSAFLHLALNTLETCEKHCLAAFPALPLAHLPKHSHNQTPTNHGCPGACRRPVIMSSRSSRVITCHHVSSRVITCHHRLAIPASSSIASPTYWSYIRLSLDCSNPRRTKSRPRMQALILRRVVSSTPRPGEGARE